MFLIPITFLFFVLLLPALFFLGYFHIISIGFERLGFSSEAVVLIFILMLVGSMINIPLTRKKIVEVKKKSFFGLFKSEKLRVEGLAINVGGAIVPILISIYFLSKIPFQPVLAATLLMILSSKFLARIVPGKGIVIPAFLPPILAFLFAWLFAPDFTAATAFVSGVLGTLIGADILNLPKALKKSPGLISIGGAGVFDGIFLTGIVSALFV